MSDVLGDTTHLHQHRIDFNAVHTIVGASSHGSFCLVDSSGLRHLLSSRASVKIVSQSLTCQVIGPASADKAVSIHVAVIPATATGHPTSEAQILTIGGSAYAQHSLYVGALAVPLAFSTEVAHQIKPAPVVGEPPLVVYVCTITGGTNSDKAYLRISGTIEVDGIGYVQPW